MLSFQSLAVGWVRSSPSSLKLSGLTERIYSWHMPYSSQCVGADKVLFSPILFCSVYVPWGGAWDTTWRAQSQGHHIIDRLEERGVERRSGRRSSLKGQQRAIVNRMKNGTVSKATLGKLLRDGVERIRAFSSAQIPSWTELCTPRIYSHARWQLVYVIRLFCCVPCCTCHVGQALLILSVCLILFLSLMPTWTRHTTFLLSSDYVAVKSVPVWPVRF